LLSLGSRKKAKTAANKITTQKTIGVIMLAKSNARLEIR